MKMGLANAVVDNKASASSFSREELKDLFRLDDREGCQTHDLLRCTCDGRGLPEEEPVSEVATEEDEDEDDDVNLLNLRRASQVDMDAQEAKIQKRRTKTKPGKQPKLRMLMEYAHIDTKILREAEDQDEISLLVDDDVLLEVVREQHSRVGFLLTKSSS